MDCCNHENENHIYSESKKNDHKHHDGHGSPGMNHGSAKDFLKRFWIVSILLVPLVITNTAIANFLHLPIFELGRWIQFGIATVVFGFSLVFFQHAWHEIKMRKYGMMTLVSLAVGAGYLFSVVSTFIPSLGVQFYLEIATLIWVLLFGHYLEARSSSAAGDALSEVAKLLPKKAHRISENNEEEVDITDLKEGDVVLVKPGEKVPADGEVIEGTSNVNESLISGESKPIEKKVGFSVVAGSIVLDGSLTIKLSRVGEHSTIGQIQKLITRAGQTKPRSQKLADKASAVLTFTALGVAVLTVLVWSLVIGQPFLFSITLAITVLVIACPHALGLAIPTVTTIATSLAVKNGIFIKNLAKVEIVKKANYVVFDKTGTLTNGEFGVTDVVAFDSYDKNKIIQVTVSLEKYSSHIIGQSILLYAKKQGISFSDIDNFKNISGKGIRGSISGNEYFVGNRGLMIELGVLTDEKTKKAEEFFNDAKTVIFVADNKNVMGIIALSDTIKSETPEAIKKLHSLGIKVAMLTGDNEDVASAVARELKIDTYFSEVLPEDKYKYIKKLQDEGNTVLMVGDGVNDAPALTQADVGIAIGAGTDVAVEAGDVVLMKNNPEDVVRLIILSRKVYSKMIQNLVWALGYNIIAIPAAAGVFASFGFFLRPEIGALLMSLSTVIVVVNAMFLRRINLEHIPTYS